MNFDFKWKKKKADLIESQTKRRKKCVLMNNAKFTISLACCYLISISLLCNVMHHRNISLCIFRHIRTKVSDFIICPQGLNQESKWHPTTVGFFFSLQHESMHRFELISSNIIVYRNGLCECLLLERLQKLNIKPREKLSFSRYCYLASAIKGKIFVHHPHTSTYSSYVATKPYLTKRLLP